MVLYPPQSNETESMEYKEQRCPRKADEVADFDPNDPFGFKAMEDMLEGQECYSMKDLNVDMPNPEEVDLFIESSDPLGNTPNVSNVSLIV